MGSKRRRALTPWANACSSLPAPAGGRVLNRAILGQGEEIPMSQIALAAGTALQIGSSPFSVRPTSPVTTISDAATAPPRSSRNSGMESRAIPGRRAGTAEKAVTRTPASTETAAAQGRPRSIPPARPSDASRWGGSTMPSTIAAPTTFQQIGPPPSTGPPMFSRNRVKNLARDVRHEH